jgi:hypothetical protein
MKSKFLNVFVLMLVAVVFVTVGVLTAADIPKVIMLEEAKEKKGPVKFDHEKHEANLKIACTECHHVYKDGKNVWKQGDPVQKCSACHDLKEKKGNADKLQNAFHKNCKDCHKKEVEAGKVKNAPFKKCNDCHQGKDKG